MAIKRKRILWNVLPLILVIIIISLPLEKNISIRNAITESLSTVWNLLFSITKEENLSLVQALKLKVWNLEQEKNHLYTILRAKNLEPFIETPDPSCEKEYSYIIGKVLSRSNNTWNSTIWINRGKKDNERLGYCVIDTNSPVLSGDSVVGVVDYVGKTTSLVRLITDCGMCPAVRILRKKGCPINPSILKTIGCEVESQDSLFETEEEKKAFLYLVNKLEQSLPQQETEYLAKGELQGHGEPFFRTPGNYLKGVGFNYDFKDAEGPARDLRTGTPYDPEEEYTQRTTTPLLKAGDLLITSGLDGIFPKGLKVATIDTVFPLKEGDYSYELVATPTAEDLHDLEFVVILPPQKIAQELIPSKNQRILEQIGQF